MEPQSERTPLEVREARFAWRMKSWLKEPGTRWTKAVLNSNGQIIGHTGWAEPGRKPLWSVWRIKRLEHDEREGWTPEKVQEMCAHIDIEAWDSLFTSLDLAREELMADSPHW